MKSFEGFLRFTGMVSLALAASAGAQGFTKADSGWVSIFNGVDWTGLFSRNYGNVQPVHPPGPPYIILYAGTDTATIKVNATSPTGNIGTDDTTFSHYRVRWEGKFDVVNTGNAGLTYHTDETKIRMQNNWPRSIEFQMKQDEGGSAFSIQQVTFTTRTTGTGQGSNYSATGSSVVNACEIGCNGRWYRGNPLIRTYAAATPTVPRWLRYHLIVRGSDSAVHAINDTVVMRLWNIRIYNDSTRNTGSTSSGSTSASNKTPSGPYDHGGFGIQSEGALVSYRRWEVMRIPPSTPMNEHFLHRLVLDNPRQAIKPAPGSPLTLQWRSIGTIPKVKIEYRVGVSGAWQIITDSTGNTGAYNWTAPAQVPDSLYVRLSSYDYVTPDFTASSGIPTALGMPGARLSPQVSFALNSRGLTLSGVEGFRKAEIFDPSGQAIRILPVRERNVHWDLTAASGQRAPKGVYFVRLTGAKDPHTLRVPVF